MRESAMLEADLRAILAEQGKTFWPSEIERSLDTTDYDEAAAHPFYLEQLAIYRRVKLLTKQRRQKDTTGRIHVRRSLPPGYRETTIDGWLLTATASDIFEFPPAGSGLEMRQRKNEWRDPVVMMRPETVEADPEYHKEMKPRDEELAGKEEPPEDEDTKNLNAYIKARLGKPKQKGLAQTTRNALRMFKAHVNDRRVVDCKWADVEEFIQAHLTANPGGASNLEKHIRYLVAAVNYANSDPDNPKYPSNIFAKHKFEVPKRPRPLYEEEHIEVMRPRLDELGDDEKLLLVWHASAGIRPTGIASIRQDNIKTEREYDLKARGYKVIAEHKTRRVYIESDKDRAGHEYGKRWLPIPQVVLDLKRQDGSYFFWKDHPDGEPRYIHECPGGKPFTKSHKAIMANINSWLRTLAINYPDRKDPETGTVVKGLTFYCFRHRARDRMRPLHLPKDMSEAILGHAREMDQHNEYGHGHDLWRMKEAIDQIGF
jgi:hypothetical protein